MYLTINGFRKYNARSDLKSMTWFRVQNNFYELEDLYDESYTTCYLFLFLIAQCAQKNEEMIKYNEKYLVFKSRMKKTDFVDSLKCLIEKQVVTMSNIDNVQIPYGHHTDTCTTNERTNITNTSKESNKFDLNDIYLSYPKKQGKALGIKKLQVIIKKQEQYDIILQGAINYKKYVTENKIEARFVKQFSTWVNQESWLDEMITESSKKFDPFENIRNECEFKNEI